MSPKVKKGDRTLKSNYEIVLLKGRKNWFWRLTARNGKTIAHSETYSSKQKALKTAKKLGRRLKCPLITVAD